jgi:hypothetical protein
MVSGMSADDSVVVGVWGNEGPAWRWTAQIGAVDIGSVSQQVKISRDGRTIVGTAKDDKARIPLYVVGRPGRPG